MHPVLLLVALAATAACSSTDSAPVVASVDVTLSKDEAALGSPIDMTYEFDVAEGASIPAGYHVLVHVLDEDGRVFWNDDHDPPMPTEDWQAGTPVVYTRTAFIPAVPALGEATVRVGLYREDERLRLEGPVAEENARPEREYSVATFTLVPLTENILLVRGTGWHPVEFDAEQPSREWEWTQGQATLTFQNPRQDVRFYLDFDARPDVFETPQVVTVRSGDQVVATFPADQIDRVLRQIDITAEQLGTADRAELTIEVDQTFVPADLPNGGGDVRVLGIRVYHAHVEIR